MINGGHFVDKATLSRTRDTGHSAGDHGEERRRGGRGLSDNVTRHHATRPILMGVSSLLRRYSFSCNIEITSVAASASTWLSMDGKTSV